MLKSIILSKIVGSVIRHGATIIGGWLLSEGYADQAAAEAIAGGIVASGGVAWSVAEKKARNLLILP